MNYFTSDLHLGHKNIILPSYDNRPFSTIKEHDQTIINNINQTVTTNDLLYILGDIGMCSSMYLESLLEKIHCKNLYLIRGNHDYKIKKKLLEKYFEIHDILLLSISGQQYFLCHYPAESWAKKSWGVIHLHGHSHGKSRVIHNRLDVGINIWNYKPISEFQIQEILERKKNENPSDNRLPNQSKRLPLVYSRY